MERGKIKNQDLIITNSYAVRHSMSTINSLTEKTIKKSFKKPCFMTKHE